MFKLLNLDTIIRAIQDKNTKHLQEYLNIIQEVSKKHPLMEVGEVMVATKVINGTMYSLSIKNLAIFIPQVTEIESATKHCY